MKRILLPLVALMILCQPAFAQQQQQEKPDPYKLAAKEAERLQDLLTLEDDQVFRVEITLQENYQGVLDEYEQAHNGGMQNAQSFQAIQDKWQEKTEAAYKEIFTEEQWKLYLKRGGERIIKDREKRQQAALESGNALKEKTAKKKKK